MKQSTSSSILIASLFCVALLLHGETLADTTTTPTHSHTHVASGYSFQLTRIHQSLPAIDSQIGRSVFDYNYNAAWLPLFSSSQADALLVRCQYNTSSSSQPPNTYAVSASQLAIAPFSLSKLVFDKIVRGSVVFNATEPYEQLGTEDPRVVYRSSNGVYYMLYSAVQDVNGTTICRLALATSINPTLYSNWTRYGPIFPDVNGFQWSKSGSLLVRDGFAGPSFLFYGDSSYVPGLQLALTQDLIHYQQVPGVWMPVRNDSFDSTLVEAGPYPIMLSDGNYLFLYNSARSGFSSPKPGYDLQYNVGWAILDGKDPTKIIARCDEPILTPTLAWEVGNAPFLGLTPNVVFVEGWRAVGVDTFMLFYGAADSVIGVALLKVTVPQST